MITMVNRLQISRYYTGRARLKRRLCFCWMIVKSEALKIYVQYYVHISIASGSLFNVPAHFRFRKKHQPGTTTDCLSTGGFKCAYSFMGRLSYMNLLPPIFCISSKMPFTFRRVLRTKPGSDVRLVVRLYLCETSVFHAFPCCTLVRTDCHLNMYFKQIQIYYKTCLKEALCNKCLEFFCSFCSVQLFSVYMDVNMS